MNTEMRPIGSQGPQEDILAVSEVFRFPVRTHPWSPWFPHPNLYVLNWQKQKLLRQFNIPPAHFDAEEYRFLNRCYHYSGARGICASEKFIFVALQNSILVYERGLRTMVRRLEHPLFNGIHEIVWQRGRLYVTCAATDSVIVMDEDGNELQRFCLGSNQFLLDSFRLPRRDLDDRLDYRIMHRVRRLFHVNSVQVRNESIYLHLNRQGSFVKIHPQEEIIIRDADLKESHNAQFTADGRYILVNDTGNHALRVFQASGAPLRSIDIRDFRLPIDFARKKSFGPGQHQVKAGWLRGLALSAVKRDIVYLGLSPAMLISVNYMTGICEGYFRFRKNYHIAVHGICNLAGNSDGHAR